MAAKSEKLSSLWLKDSIKDRDFFSVYQVTKVLGRGASAIVNQVQHKQTGQLFAAKIIEKVSSKVIRAEITALIRLDHPNVIKLHEVYENSFCVVLVLQLLTGGELFDRIVQRGFYSENDAAEVVCQMLYALSYLHQNGIVHRDLKPENILYENTSEKAALKIADFGLAKDTQDSQSLMHTICGTPNYLAPEVVQQIGYDYKVDVWGTGVITYILLCGYEPFDDERGYPVVLSNIIHARFEFHSPWWDDVSMDAKDFVSTLLKVDPKERPTAKEALQHSWLKNSPFRSKGLNLSNALTKLQQFNAKKKLKAASQAVIASNRVRKAISGNIQSTNL